MKRLLLLLCWLCALPAAAQDLLVTTLSPTPGQDSVALRSTVTFTFSAPVDTSARFDGAGPLAFFTIHPADSLVIHGMQVSEDRRAVSFDVTHRADTDYLWVLTGARAEEGALLCRPAVLSYTTRHDRGEAVVQGWAGLMFVTKQRDECSAWPSVAALLDAPPGPTAAVVAAAAVADNAEFEITGVRPGTYWPVMLLDLNRDGRVQPDWSRIGHAESEVGLYDPDWDGQVDSLVVSGAGVWEIMLGAYGSSREDPAVLPGRARLLQNYPNPFAGSTRLRFELARPMPLVVAVYDLLGRQVARPARGWFTGGWHEVAWAADGLTAGTYVLRLEGPDFTLVRPLVVLR